MIECDIWWSAPLENTAEHLALLDQNEVGRHEAYRQDIDKRRFLTGRVLAKTVAAERLGRTPADIVFDATCPDCAKPHGVPRVPGSPLALSISHSGDRIGLAVTESSPVGLDVEGATRRADRSLIEHALSEQELAELTALPEDRWAPEFFRYWTRKEALMKATGKGLRIPLQSITLSGPGTPARLIASGDPALPVDGTQLSDLDPGEGYRAAVAVLSTEELKITERWFGA